MARTLSPTAPRTHDESLHGDLHGLRAGSANVRIGVNQVLRLALIGIVRQCMSETGTDQKTIAINARVNEATVSDALSLHGTRHLAAEWILAQDKVFIAAFLKRLAQDRGIDGDAKRTLLAEQIGNLVRLVIEGAA